MSKQDNITRFSKQDNITRFTNQDNVRVGKLPRNNSTQSRLIV